MDQALEKFSLQVSQGHHEIESLLKNYSKKQKPSNLPRATKALVKKIEKYKSELSKNGIPPFLAVAKVNEFIQTGVFLKPDAKALKAGEFIGIYSGELEIVFATETQDNHYAYDVATNIKIKKHHLPLVRSKGKKADIKEDYSIQTNAAKTGNFTRYINHSSVDTNIDAMTKVLPDGSVEVCLFTKKRIRPGEQLLSNYGGMYWAVLPIIPEPVFANSYILNKEGKVIKKQKKDLSHPSDIHPLLRTLRHPLELDTDDLQRSFASFLFKKKIKLLSPSLITKIESFEDDILERGLPLRYEIVKDNTATHFGIKLKKQEKAIKKGAFIGVFGGKWCAIDHAASDKINAGFTHKHLHLYLDPQENGNFTRLIPFTEDGNVKAVLHKKAGTKELYIILTALREIKVDDLLKIQK